MRQKILTYVVAGIFILFPSVAIATTYDFVPMELTKVPMSYMSGAPNSTVPFYYTDGTRADYDESMTRIRNTVAQPHIFVNDDNQYGMVVIDIKEDKIPFINYTGIPKTLKYYGFSRGKATSDVVVINTQGGPMPVLLEDEMVEMMADAIN